MRKLFCLLLFISQFTMAQKITIKGQLKDTTDAPLPSATILLLNPQDSSLLNFGASGQDGSFEISNLTRQEYLFKISFVGYATLTQMITPSPGESMVDLGVMRMKPEIRQLNEVTVRGEKAPVTIKKDTIEFNAGSFKTRENAVVEDLLKKLPGVEVDNDGTIRAQGEQVKRVTVDGKDFFGNDPKLATRNLPADAIEKVQVYDKKSDQAVFSGIDDGQREKTINLELKEEKRNGAFGNIMVGAGTDDRYQGKASLNRFKKGQQFSLLAMANNTNEPGFGIDEYMNFTGGSQQMASGSGRGLVRMEVKNDQGSGIPLNFGGRNNGVMNNYAGGMNFNQEFSKKTALNASYFYNHLEHDLDQLLERINYMPDGNSRFNQNSRQNNTNYNHRVNTTLEHKIDSLNSLKWTTSATYNETDTHEESTSENLSPEGTLLNQGARITLSDGTSVNLNTNLLWRHRFAKKGRTFSANVQLAVTNSDRDGSQDATTEYSGEMEAQTILQTSNYATDYLSYGAALSYTEPLGNRKYLEANYNFRQNLNDVNKEVYDVNNGEPVFNTLLSNQYNSDYQYHRGGLNFRMNRTDYTMTIGASAQQTYLQGELKLTNSTISKSYQNLLPVVRFNYDLSNSKHIRLDYETSVQEPTIQQLQPVVDNSDPLNLYVGNPELRPAYVHNWRLNFTTFDPVSFISLFAFLNAGYTENAIVTSQQFSEQQVRISQPVNVDNIFRLTGNASFGFPVRKIGSRFNVSANVVRQNSINVVNDAESKTVQNSLGGIFRYDFRYKEIFDLNLRANLSSQSTSYEFDEQTDQLFFNKTFTAETNLSFMKNYQFSTSLEYLVYENKTTDEKQSIPLLNLSLSRFFLKAKSGELRFSVNNLLDRNIGVSQQADINYFERVTSNSLGRYFMVSFIYALNKQLNPVGMRPRGGGIRIMR